MSAVNELIAREYFELLGYLVCQPRKYSVPGRQKTASEEVDLVVHRPGAVVEAIPERMVWRTSDFEAVPRAVVAIRGWHTERFYASTFEQTPDILRFVEDESIRFAGKLLGTESMAKVLCLPRLPASGELKDQTIELLRDKGIDGVISFHTMLAEIVARVETHRNYDKSDLLQIVRLLKNYDLLRDPQMELFSSKKSKKSTGAR